MADPIVPVGAGMVMIAVGIVEVRVGDATAEPNNEQQHQHQ